MSRKVNLRVDDTVHHSTLDLGSGESQVPLSGRGAGGF